ncbi:RidA family protein [Spirosoma endbachense]|nr:RidA family protein [Spirosoma endbachense]
MLDKRLQEKLLYKQQPENMNSTVEFLNPDELLKNPAFSQIAITKGNGSTIYIGGQNAITKDLEIIGKGDITLQTEYILKNIEIALNSCDATVDDLFKLTIYIVQGQDVRKGFEGAQGFLKKLSNPPVITGIVVAGLANPDYLVEIEAVAFKREK